MPEKRAIDLVGVGVYEREVQVFIRLRGPKLPDLPANPEWLTVVDRSKCGVDLLAHFSNRERSSRFGEQFIHATYDTVAPMTKTPQPSLTDSIDVIAGVGPRMAKAFETLGLSTIEDLLWHVPVRYELDRAGSSINEVEEIVGHETDAAENISVIGTLAAIRTTPGRSPRIEATLDDGTGTIRLIWFNAGWMRRKLRPGMMLSAEGRASRFKGYLQLSNPSWTILNDDEPFEERSEGFRPIYPATEELPSRKIATVLESVLDHATALIAEPLPEALRTHHALPPLGRAFRMVHLPNDLDEVETARRRLAFDELLLLQLGVMLKRQHLRSSLSAPPFPLSDAIHKRIIKRFPFELTTDQASACSEIARDLGSTIPMNRLLQGDVGAGKTVVALSGMLLAAAHSAQAVLLAPTELLAEQHHASITQMLSGSDVSVELLTGTLTASERTALRERIASGACSLVVGTHAILSEDITFDNLGFVIIDEQHRFGVEQRARLRRPNSDGVVPHVLVMTATPIPRTLSLTIFGDLDVTVIRHLPPGRQPIATRVVAPADSEKVYGFLAERIRAGEQGYVVVPAVEESDLGLKNVHAHLKTLASGALHDATLEVLHGRMNRAEREDVMTRFRKGTIDVLVATVVIEVGVDVANASMMVVEHAERFGLAQLHQLRGRVGRGTARSVCAFIGEPTTDDGRKRLEAIAETDDGFKIAELDLAIRGPGELFGARQSGLPPLRVANLVEDLELLGLARRDAIEWIERDPHLREPSSKEAKRLVLSRYGTALGLGDVG